MAAINYRKIIFMDLAALLAAEYAGLCVQAILSFALGGDQQAGGIVGLVAMTAFTSFFFVPFAIFLTWKAALIAIVAGELLRRSWYFYPMAGIIAGYWTGLSPIHAAGRFDGFILTVSGGVAGCVFWSVAVRSFDFDLAGEGSKMAGSSTPVVEADDERQQVQPSANGVRTRGKTIF